MADLIRIIPERVREEAANIRSCHEQYLRITDKLNNLVMNLGDVWEGKAYEAFVTNYNEVQKQITRFTAIFDQCTDDMEKISGVMEDTDRTLMAKINNL